jgi:cell cycle sensor histidine kinase DivJ
VSILSTIRDCLDALLHPSARYDALMRARHRAFIAPRLLGSLVAFAVFPIYLAMRGAPSALEVAGFAWLIAPILFHGSSLAPAATRARMCCRRWRLPVSS